MKPLLIAALFFVASSESFAQMPPPPPPPPPMQMPATISVSGEAKETVAPDQATITATITSREQNLNVAKKNNDAQMEKVVGIAKEFSIPREKIIPSYMNINPEYTYNNATQKSEMTGYIVSRTVRIIMTKLDIHERVLSALVDAKIDQVSGIEFSVANPEAISDRLRIKAVENAKARATALAAAAGVKLGKPMTINTGGGYRPPMPYMAMARGMSADGAAEKMSVAPSLPGMLEMYESVNIVFTLE